MDEILVEAPGKCTLNIEKSFAEVIKDGLDPLDPNVDLTKYKINLYYDNDEESQHWGNIVVGCMEEAQQLFFGNILPSKASVGINPYWSH